MEPNFNQEIQIQKDSIYNNQIQLLYNRRNKIIKINNYSESIRQNSQNPQKNSLKLQKINETHEFNTSIAQRETLITPVLDSGENTHESRTECIANLESSLNSPSIFSKNLNEENFETQLDSQNSYENFDSEFSIGGESEESFDFDRDVKNKSITLEDVHPAHYPEAKILNIFKKYGPLETWFYIHPDPDSEDDLAEVIITYQQSYSVQKIIDNYNPLDYPFQLKACCDGNHETENNDFLEHSYLSRSFIEENFFIRNADAKTCSTLNRITPEEKDQLESIEFNENEICGPRRVIESSFSIEHKNWDDELFWSSNCAPRLKSEFIFRNSDELKRSVYFNHRSENVRIRQSIGGNNQLISGSKFYIF